MAAVIAGVSASVLAGCGSLPALTSDEHQLAAGEAGGTRWQAVAYQSADEGTCVQLRFEGGGAQAICRGAGGGPLGGNVITTPDGLGEVILVEVLNSTMVRGDLIFDLRPGVPVTIADAGPLGRYAVAGIDGAVPPLQLVMHDATGTTRETIGLP